MKQTGRLKISLRIAAAAGLVALAMALSASAQDIKGPPPKPAMPKDLPLQSVLFDVEQLAKAQPNLAAALPRLKSSLDLQSIKLDDAGKVLCEIIGPEGASAIPADVIAPFGGEITGERLERMRRSPEYVDGRFVNSPPYKGSLALWQNLQDYSAGQVRTPSFAIPVMPLPTGSLQAPPVSGLRAIWFGHSTVLLEIDGVRIMTDPVLSQRASPFQFIGPERMHPPPIPLSRLEGIDAAVMVDGRCVERLQLRARQRRGNIALVVQLDNDLLEEGGIAHNPPLAVRRLARQQRQAVIRVPGNPETLVLRVDQVMVYERPAGPDRSRHYERLRAAQPIRSLRLGQIGPVRRGVNAQRRHRRARVHGRELDHVPARSVPQQALQHRRRDRRRHPASGVPRGHHPPHLRR